MNNYEEIEELKLTINCKSKKNSPIICQNQLNRLKTSIKKTTFKTMKETILDLQSQSMRLTAANNPETNIQYYMKTHSL